MDSEIKPGWYHSALPHIGYRVMVHSVQDERVYFTRLGMAHMSISSVETFRGIVQFPAIRTVQTIPTE